VIHRLGGRPGRSALAGAALAVALGGGLTACGGDDGEAAAVPAGDPDAPNLVVVETDDQSPATFNRRVMPRTFRLLVDRGTTFRNSFAAPPRCCPSRAGLLTGQYPHNHGILWNNPSGVTQPESTLATWLRDEGYATALIGKFLNGYVTEEQPEAAPGFERWFALSAEGEPSYTDPEVSVDGEMHTFHTYLTSLLNRRAERFAEQAGEGPFFLWQAHYAPHPRPTKSQPCRGFAPEPLPRDYPPFAEDQPPRGPAYNERDVSDKPDAIASLPLLTAGKRAQARRNFRCTEASLREVDRGVAHLVRVLKESGELADTLFVFTSDNGMLFGEHRISHGKVEPYEESIDVPLVMLPGRNVIAGEPPPNLDQMVANIDLAPTMVELAETDTCSAGECRTPDGRSLAGLLAGNGAGFPADRGILFELEPPRECGYRAIRTPDHAYIEREGGEPGECEPDEYELYDLGGDPFELDNVAATDSAVADELAARLAALASCSGTGAGQADPCE
jgi:N-acetylglucosamine-6-sulfatase